MHYSYELKIGNYLNAYLSRMNKHIVAFSDSEVLYNNENA